MRWRAVALAIGCVITRVSGSDQASDAYVAEHVMPTLVEVLPSLTTQQRDRDVFGFAQRGDALAGVADAAEGAAAADATEAEPEKPTLATALQYLPVVGIDPENREFFVGSRSIFEGDVLVLNHGGEQFNAVVLGVRSRQITMEDVDSGLRASIRIDLVPPDEWDHPAITRMGK